MDFYLSELHLSSAKLKCTICKNYLSVFPVYTSSTDGNLCGRCVSLTTKTSDNFIQNEAYEAVSQFVNFPCRYEANGCSEEILPKDMLQHEVLCPYKPLKCPTINSTRCTWEGPYPEMLQHCQSKHIDLMISEEFHVDLSKAHQQKNFLGYEGTLFAVLQKFDLDKNLLLISISHVDGISVIKNFSCKLFFKDDNKREYSVPVKTTDSKNLDYAVILMDHLKSESRDLPTVLVKIVFDNPLDQENNNNSDVLSSIRCSLCCAYCIPPIFSCMDNLKLVCAECHLGHVRQCEKCANDGNIETKSRNINLDKLVSLLNYPCKYQAKGCNFVSKPNQAKKHHRFCSYRDYFCPVKEFERCVWTGSANHVKNHVLDNHSSMVLQSSEKILFPDCKRRINTGFYSRDSGLINSSNILCKIIKFGDHLFRLNLTKIDDNFCWELQLVGNCQKRFIYEIEIINVNMNRSLSKKQLCSLITPKNDLFKDEEYFCCFEKSQVAKFTSAEQLLFKVNIFKEN